MGTLGKNQIFEIKNEDGTSFHNLVLHKSTVESIVMSLGDKISGDVYYKNNALSVSMHEYIVYNGVKYMLVTPPTIIREGVVSDNSELRGMTKYSFVFYHPMYSLANFPFCDVAVTSDEERYLGESKKFSWIGYPNDYIAKLNKNLDGTEWIVEKSSRFPQDKDSELSPVIPFENATIADALKTWYDTWGLPYIVDVVSPTEPAYAQGKRFKVVMGMASNEVYENESARRSGTPFVFRMGQGVGLKNNSRTPRNNKIVTRISGCGSENNIPYGYPQIRWYGASDRAFTYGDHAGVYNNVTIGGHTFSKVVSYPIYKGILGGAYVELINHPFTRKNLMPSVYRTCLFNKVSFLNTDGTPNLDYDPDIELVDYYDAIYSSEYPYPNPINVQSPSYESHTFEDIKPELGEAEIVSATPLNNDLTPAESWDDTIDNDGNYIQSYFKMVLPVLSFDLYACAAVTEEMQINMRGGSCLGCTFTVQVDWDDYKRNFYDEDGNFAPDGEQRDLSRYPKSNLGQIEVVLQKEDSTFGTIMPNMYQYPVAGDDFVILGISLPDTYITTSERELDDAMKSYMLENNEHYFDYPLKFDEAFLSTHEHILSQIRPNTIIRFEYAGETLALSVKQLSVKFGESPLPKYDITLTDNVEVVLNQIGKVADDVEKLSTLIAILRQEYNRNVWSELAKKLSKTQDDTAQGFITFLKGLQVSDRFTSGLGGEGGVFRKDADGKVYIEADKLYVRMRAYFDNVEIKNYEHTSGNRIASKAGLKCVKVEAYNANDVLLATNPQTEPTGTSYYRLYFRAKDGEDSINNDFVNGDQAFCDKTTFDNNIISHHRYWRLVVGKNGNLSDSDEFGFIDLSASDKESGSDVPQAGDDVSQLGNRTNTERQGAIIEFVGGDNAPAYQIYQGINTYSLSGKCMIDMGFDSQTGLARMNVVGNFRFGSPLNTGSYIKYDSQANQGQGELKIKAHVEFTNSDAELDALVQEHQTTYDDSAVWSEMDNLQDQIDGAIESWFLTGVPTLQNAPANTWTTDAEKNNHIGDLYYDKATGHGYRFMFDNEEEVYLWTPIADEDIARALENAAKAQETADGKSTTYLTRPSKYKAGDLWILQSAQTINGVSYKAGDVLTASTDSETYSETHWSKQVRYTDDTKADSILANQYYQKLTGGTYDNGISEAKSAAATAQSTANTAKDNAAAANTRLTTWADDTKISPTEKLALKNQKADVQKEYAQIITDAAKYTGVSTTAFTAAYNKAITAFNYYTASTPENIDIITDSQTDSDATPRYSRIADYYAARQTILEAITTAAKNYATAQGNKYLDDAVYRAISAALGSNTDIVGGLVLTSLIGMRDSSEQVWGGISGQYDATAYGYGIAAWYGGAMVDKEVTPSAANSAKSLFRMDGSGYLAGGNITWDSTGRVTIKDLHTDDGGTPTDVLQEMSAFREMFDLSVWASATRIKPLQNFEHLKITRPSGYTVENNDVLTRNENDARYMVADRFKALFRVYNGNSDITDSFFTNGLPTDTSNVSIKAMFDFWSQGGITALGQGSQGGGGGGSTTLYGLNDVSKNAAGDGVLGAENGYVLTYNGATNHWYAAPTPETYVLPTATAAALGGIKIGYATSGKNYAVQLANGQAYVNVPWTDTTYSLPLAANGTRGGIQLGYTQSGKNYPVQLSGEKAYVNVPWENTTYTLAGLMGSSAKGSTTQPIYWNGSAFANTSYTLGKSVPSDAKFTDTTYSANNGVGLSGTTFYNSGVRATTINGNYLRVNTNGTNADLTIPYATNANYAATAGSAPASDVYAWAKAASKPSYHAGELDVTPTSYKVTNVAAGIAPYIRDIGTDIFAGATTSEIKVERSLDNGSTWSDVTASEEANVKNVFSGCVNGTLVVSGHSKGVVGDRLRITFNPSGGSRYCQLAFIYVYFSSNGCGCVCDVEKNYYTNQNSWYAYATDAPIAGWSGPNIIGMGATIFGQNDSRDNGYGIRMTFRITSVSADYDSRGYIYSIQGFTANRAWGTPSNSIAKTNTPYTITDADRRVTFDNSVTASGFIKSGSSDSYVLLGGGGHAAISGLSVSYATTSGSCSGNAASATKLQTARTINGTSFDGSANITTANWGTARNLSIADSDSTNIGSAVSVNGSAAVTLKLPSTIKATLSGNAASASKLTTVSKTAWGQTFWTSDGVPTSISGALSSVTNITMSGYIKIGDAYLTFDSNNNAIRVSKNADGTGAANFYAIGGVSALGASEGGGGGGQGDVTWELLKNNSDTRPIALSHLTGALTDYATKSWVGQQGYVTSSGVTSVATGTGLTGGTITSTGTISINSTYQTYISHGESAYNSLSNYYPVLNGSGKWSESGNGNNAYCFIAEINTNEGYINYPITFEIGGRGTITSRVTILFANQKAVDPDCKLFVTDEATCYYLYKAAANTWRLYASSPSDGVWGTWYVYRVYGNTASKVTMKMETVSSLPSGYRNVTYTGNVAYASSAGSVAWSNVSSHPTKLSQFTNDSGFVTSSGVTSITLKAGGGISLDIDNTAITTTGTRTITNSGVRATTINGNYLRVNTNGTNADLTIPYATSAGSATIANSPYGFSFSNRASNDWSGVTGIFITDWAHSSGADIMFKYNGGALHVITDGYFYQGIDYRGASYRVLDTYDRDNTTWSNADTLDGVHNGDVTAQYFSAGKTLTQADTLNTLLSGVYGYINANNPTGSVGDNCIFLGFRNSPRTDTLQIVGAGNEKQLYYRIASNVGNSYEEWSGWKTVIDSANIGSQSVNYANTAGNADTVDGYHLTSGYCYKNVHTSITNSSGADWYIQVETTSYINKDSVIGILATGNNVFSECVIHILCRSNKYWGWQTHYNGTAIIGIDKATSYGEQIYLKIPSYMTTVTVSSTDTVTITKADYSSRTYQNVASEGMFSNYIMGTLNGNATTSSSCSGNAATATKLQTARTIWGQSFDGTGDISISTHAKMTYVLFKNYNDNNPAGYCGRGSGSSNRIYLQAYSGNDIDISANDGSGDIFINTSHYVGIGTQSPSYKLHVAGTLYSSGVATFGGDVLPAANMAQSLGSDSYRWEHIHGKFIWAKGPAPAVYACNESGNWIALHWASDANRGLYDSNNWIIGYNGTNTFMGGGNVGIGTSSPSYKLHVSGDIYATGGVTSLSDARHKTIMGDTKLRVEQIADMPAIIYRWSDRRDDALHVGSIAQNWQRILPEVVSVANDLEGTLSINYGVAAMIASIVTAKKVVDHEARIKALESECERLREENKQLRLKIA